MIFDITFPFIGLVRLLTGLASVKLKHCTGAFQSISIRFQTVYHPRMNPLTRDFSL